MRVTTPSSFSKSLSGNRTQTNSWFKAKRSNHYTKRLNKVVEGGVEPLSFDNTAYETGQPNPSFLQPQGSRSWIRTSRIGFNRPASTPSAVLWNKDEYI